MKTLLIICLVLVAFACSKSPHESLGYQYGKNKHTVTPPPPMVAMVTTNDPLFSKEWGLVDIGAPTAWANGHVGSKDVLIGFIDEGFNKYEPELLDNIAPFAINMTMYRQNNPVLGIGTNLAGIIGAKANNGLGTVGVCWNVGLIDAKGIYGWSYYMSDINACIQYFIQLKREGHNVVAIQNAWDWYSGVDSTILASIKEAGDLGILYIRASGYHTHISGGIDATPVSPLFAGMSNVITVSAYDSTGNVPANANTSKPYVDLFAPGEYIPYANMTYIGNWAFYDGRVIRGTPIAASFVTGAVALYAASHPTATMLEIKQAIMSTVTKDPRYSDCLSEGKLNIVTF